MIKGKNIKKIGSIVMAILGLVGITMLAMTIKKPKKSVASPTVIMHSTDKPSEIKPDKNYVWAGGSQDPKKIIIPQISADGYVQQVGVDQNNQVAVPDNLYMVGWFVQTVQPGKPGLSVIDGHVTGRMNDGIFKNLDQLKSGDKFTIEQGSGNKLTYQVISSQSASAEKSVGIIFSQDPKAKSQLNLVTCSGTYNQETRSYPDRLVVAAKLI